MKGIVRDIVIVFGLVVLWLSTYRPAMEYICEKRDGTEWWVHLPLQAWRPGEYVIPRCGKAVQSTS